MFTLGQAIASDKAVMEIVIPSGGVIVTQVSCMGLLPNGQPETMTIETTRVIDAIGVKRHEGPRIPGKIAGDCTLEVDASCPGAVAMTITMVCNSRTPSAKTEVIDDSLDVGGDDIQPGDTAEAPIVSTDDPPFGGVSDSGDF